jgi:hypothetical protein
VYVAASMLVLFGESLARLARSTHSFNNRATSTPLYLGS